MLNDKKYIQYSEFSVQSVFQGKRKLLKNPDAAKTFGNSSRQCFRGFAVITHSCACMQVVGFFAISWFQMFSEIRKPCGLLVHCCFFYLCSLLPSAGQKCGAWSGKETSRKRKCVTWIIPPSRLALPVREMLCWGVRSKICLGSLCQPWINTEA